MMNAVHFADIEEQYAKDKLLKRADVAKLDEWQRMQPHLPPPIHPIETALFLHSCYYNNEAAKKCIDLYYTCRRHYPEFLSNLDPFSPELQLGMDTCYMIALPDLTPEGYMVFYTNFIDPNPDVFNYHSWLKIIEIVATLAAKERGCEMGHIIIFDIKNAKIGHLMKINVISMKRAFFYLQNAVPLRLKAMHFVNGMSLMDSFWKLSKPFIRQDIHDVVHNHFGDNSTIFKFVPRDILPIECGGSKFCAQDYFKNVTRKDIERHAEFLQQYEIRVVDESKRPPKSKNNAQLFGVEGTFKNLEFD